MPALRPIDFYFDFSSPYGYFLSEKISTLAGRYGRTVTWRPVLQFAVLRGLNLPWPMENPVKRDYLLVDFERSARFLGIDYRLPPHFPALTQHAARAFYLLQSHAPGMEVCFAQLVMRSYWREGRDISDINVIAELVTQIIDCLGASAEVSEQLKTDVARAYLQDAIAGAIERRAFGSPFIIIDGEPFFGVDRLPQIEARLAQGSAA